MHVVIETPFGSTAVLQSRQRLRPPFAEAPFAEDGLELWLELYRAQDGGARHALLLDKVSCDVDLRSHGYDQTSSWDDRTQRGSLSHFFIPKDSLLPAQVADLPWRWDGTLLSCALSTSSRGIGMDRESAQSVDERLELTRDTVPFTRWRGVYRYVRYEDSAP